MTLRKGARDRESRGAVGGPDGLRLMAEAKGVLRELSLDLLEGEVLETEFLPGEELATSPRAAAGAGDRRVRPLRRRLALGRRRGIGDRWRLGSTGGAW
jgi:hypothetical protein